MKKFNKKQFLFLLVFIILGFAILQVPLTHIVGSKVSFTVFDAFAPIAGGFLGQLPGALSVFFMLFINFLVHGAHIQNVGSVIVLFPMVLATLYFSHKSKLNIIVPIVAILAFILNPIGRSVWYFSLYWLIPIVCYFWQDKSLLVRSLGSTSTAHAVGSVLWIYFLPLPKAVWISLIPVVAVERLVFTVGLAVSYLALNNILNYINEKNLLPFLLPVNLQYVWRLAQKT